MAKDSLNGPAFNHARAMLGEPINETLRQFVTDVGVDGAKDELGVSRATIYHWQAKLGNEYVKVWVPDGAALALIRHDGSVEIAAGEYTAAAEKAKRAFNGNEGA